MKPPTKLSQAMRIALADEAKVHKSKMYVVNMSEWHLYRGDPDICEVCFAGSVMAKTLGVKRNRDACSEDFGSAWSPVFDALDNVRMGFVAAALYKMGQIKFDYIPDRTRAIDKYDVGVTDYEYDRSQWRLDMFKIVRRLEKEGK